MENLHKLFFNFFFVSLLFCFLGVLTMEEFPSSTDKTYITTNTGELFPFQKKNGR